MQRVTASAIAQWIVSAVISAVVINTACAADESLLPSPYTKEVLELLTLPAEELVRREAPLISPEPVFVQVKRFIEGGQLGREGMERYFGLTFTPNVNPELQSRFGRVFDIGGFREPYLHACTPSVRRSPKYFESSPPSGEDFAFIYRKDPRLTAAMHEKLFQDMWSGAPWHCRDVSNPRFREKKYRYLFQDTTATYFVRYLEGSDACGIINVSRYPNAKTGSRESNLQHPICVGSGAVIPKTLSHRRPAGEDE